MRGLILILLGATVVATLAVLDSREGGARPLVRRPAAVDRPSKVVPVLLGEASGITVLAFDAGVVEADPPLARRLRADAWALEPGWSRVWRLLIENEGDASVVLQSFVVETGTGRRIEARPLPGRGGPGTRAAQAAWAGPGLQVPLGPRQVRRTAVLLPDELNPETVLLAVAGGVELRPLAAVRARLESVIDGAAPRIAAAELAAPRPEREAQAPLPEDEDEARPAGPGREGAR
jgi:hypothetical protein